MATQFTLDDIRAAAEREYGSKEIDLGNGKTVTLVNPLRLSKSKRDELTNIQSEFSADAEDGAEELDPLDFLIRSFEIIAGEAGARHLQEVFGEDAALYMALFELYSSEAEAGEASPSQD